MVQIQYITELKVENIDTANAMMPGAYSNIGILFKVFAPFIGEMNLYNVFIGFDIFVYENRKYNI